jgi:hypothetical protein
VVVYHSIVADQNEQNDQPMSCLKFIEANFFIRLGNWYKIWFHNAYGVVPWGH